MHPQLSGKNIVCKDFIEALEACHASNWARLTGRCNTQKNDLNKCLRGERIARSTHNREEAKVRRAKATKAWTELHQDD